MATQLNIQINSATGNLPLDFYDGAYIHFQSDDGQTFEIWKDESLFDTLDNGNFSETYHITQAGYYQVKAIANGDPNFLDSDFSTAIVYSFVTAPDVTIDTLNVSSTYPATINISQTGNLVVNSFQIFKQIAGGAFNGFDFVGTISIDSNGNGIKYLYSNEVGTYKFMQVVNGIRTPIDNATAYTFQTGQTPALIPLPTPTFSVIDGANPNYGLESWVIWYLFVGGVGTPMVDLWQNYGYILEAYKDGNLYYSFERVKGGTDTNIITNNAGGSLTSLVRSDDGSTSLKIESNDYGIYTFRIKKRTTEWVHEQYSAISAPFSYLAPANTIEPTVTTTNAIINSPIVGTGIAGATIVIYTAGGKGDNVINTVIVDSNGNWSYTPLTADTYKFAQIETGKLESNKLSIVVIEPTSGTTTTDTYIVSFANSCGNTMEYATDKTIQDSNSTSLIWQLSREFILETNTQYWCHSREVQNHSKNFKIQVTTPA